MFAKFARVAAAEITGLELAFLLHEAQRHGPVHTLVQAILVDFPEIARGILRERRRPVAERRLATRRQKVIHEPMIRLVLRRVRQSHHPIQLRIQHEGQLMTSIQLVIQYLAVGVMQLPLLQ